MTTLKYADPNGDLPIDTFYKMVFEHDKVFNASLNFLKLLRWRSRKSFTLEKDKSIWEDTCVCEKYTQTFSTISAAAEQYFRLTVEL